MVKVSFIDEGGGCSLTQRLTHRQFGHLLTGQVDGI